MKISEKAVFEAQLTNLYLFHGKIMFHFENIQFFLLDTIPSNLYKLRRYKEYFAREKVL